jgi:hypothetical protein
VVFETKVNESLSTFEWVKIVRENLLLIFHTTI